MSSNQNGHPKRKSDSSHYTFRQNQHHHSPPTKKPKLDSDDYARHTQKASKLTNLPDLPSITAEYAKSVFTHASLSTTATSQSYETLEFIGDAYLEIIASRLIWSLYYSHGFTAAKMSQVREMLVKNETLSEFCIAYGLDARLAIHAGSRPMDGRARVKLNGDVFEAYVAAVVLSDPVGGFEKAEDWLSVLWEEKLKGVNTAVPDELSKGELQKKLGGKGIRLEYVDERKPVVDKKKGLETYFVGVYLTGWGYEKTHLGSGQGLSKKAAGMDAAKMALTNDKVLNDCKTKKEEWMEKRKAEEEKEGKMNGGS